MKDCIFCKIASGEIPCSKIYEDDHFLAFMDLAPVNKGHTLIIPKQHCKDLLDFPTKLETDFIEVAKKVANAVVQSTGADAFNLSMNNGAASGQVIFHAHFHVIPRFNNDGLTHWPKRKYADGEMQEYADRIAKHL